MNSLQEKLWEIVGHLVEQMERGRKATLGMTKVLQCILYTYIEKVGCSTFDCNILTHNKNQPIVGMASIRYIAKQKPFKQAQKLSALIELAMFVLLLNHNVYLAGNAYLFTFILHLLSPLWGN